MTVADKAEKRFLGRVKELQLVPAESRELPSRNPQLVG
jgi:hypothetical protein